MKKIIMMGLFSTVGLCNMTFAANAETPEVVFEGGFDPRLALSIAMVNDIRSGILPKTMIDMFKDIPKINIATLGTVMDTQSKFSILRHTINTNLDDTSLFFLNVFLKIIVTPHESQTSAPLAETLLGEINSDITANNFSDHIFSIYCMLLSGAQSILIPQINTPTDWITVQFLGLFFDNAISSLRFNINITELDSVHQVREIVSGLNGAATLNLFFASGFQDDQQVKALQAIAEIRPKRTHIIAATGRVADLESFFKSVTDPSLHTFSEGSKIDISLIVNFQHRELNEHSRALAAMFESLSDRSMPYVWDPTLKLKSLENIAYGDLIPLIRSVVRSPMGENLSLTTLESDHPTTGYVMSRLKEEVVSPESKVQVLNFEGSQLTDEGWEQLALLAETQKPFHRIRLTGMKIPSAIAGRLGALRVQGINMVGCGVKA
ncbi:MAG: hypothetical protein Q8Q56_01410, partial [Alphaproteobacteria bacterium]|nr:hypothetical protein [Alphaproteobacteria bacterium]